MMVLAVVKVCKRIM